MFPPEQSTRYQEGSLTLEARKRGSAVWVIVGGKKQRRETTSPETATWEFGRVPKRIKIAIGCRCSSLNHQRENPRQQLKEITTVTLVQHYRGHEMPDVFSNKRPSIETVCEHEEGRKSYSTQETYEGYLKKWIVSRWRD
jgi:hypothetical protein